MNFADSKILLLLWVLPLCVFLVFVELRSVRRRFAVFARLRIEDLLTGVWSAKRTVFKSLLLCLSISLLIFALARPRWGFEWRDVQRVGTDIVIALDLSSSMLATDIPPNRLERAKREIIDLLALLKGDRIGIVAFGGVSFVYTPLTIDYRLVDMFLKQLSLKLMPVQGTAIGEALNQSISALEKASANETQGKSVILITDGEDQGEDLSATVKKAKEKGIKVHAVGIGSEAGAPIPMPDGGFKKDRDGNIVVSKLGEQTLRMITSETGGMYVHSTTGSMDLDAIYKSIKAGAQDEEGELTRQKIWHERFQIFLGLALFLLLWEFFFRSSLPKKRRAWWKFVGSSVFLFACMGSFELKASDIRDAQKAYEQKDYQTAADKFLNAEIKEPDNAVHSYNRGVSQFHNQKYKEAAEAFTKATQSQDKNLAQRSFYNLGNTQSAAQDFNGAIKAYEEALKLNPQDKDAQENMEWAKKKLEEQKKQDENKDQDKDKKDEDKKDEKKEDEKKEDKKEESKKDEKKEDQKQDQNKDQQGKEQEDKDRQKKDEKQEPKDNKDSGVEKKESEQEKQEAGKPEEKKAGNPKELTKEQAEKLLRMMEDQEQVYGMPPQYAKPPKAPERDW